MVVPGSEVLTLIQCTLCMIGNASELISQTRWSKTLDKIDPSWSKFGGDHQYRIRYLENHFNTPSQEWRKTLPSPKRFPSRNEAKRRKKHCQAPLGGKVTRWWYFSRGPSFHVRRQAGQELLPVQHIHVYQYFPKKGRVQQGQTVHHLPEVRSTPPLPQAKASIRTKQELNSNQRSPKIAGFISKEQPNQFRNKHGYGSSSKRGVAPSGQSFSTITRNKYSVISGFWTQFWDTKWSFKDKLNKEPFPHSYTCT